MPKKSLFIALQDNGFISYCLLLKITRLAGRFHLKLTSRKTSCGLNQPIIIKEKKMKFEAYFYGLLVVGNPSSFMATN